MIRRAIRDLEFENTVVDAFEASREEKISHAEQLTKESEQMRLKSMAGQRLPFADDDLLAKIRGDSTVDIRAEHIELSSQLRDLRNKWKLRSAHRQDRLIPMDERHLVADAARGRALESPALRTSDSSAREKNYTNMS